MYEDLFTFVGIISVSLVLSFALVNITLIIISMKLSDIKSNYWEKALDAPSRTYEANYNAYKASYYEYIAEIIFSLTIFAFFIETDIDNKRKNLMENKRKI